MDKFTGNFLRTLCRCICTRNDYESMAALQIMTNVLRCNWESLVTVPPTVSGEDEDDSNESTALWLTTLSHDHALSQAISLSKSAAYRFGPQPRALHDLKPQTMQAV